jgi:hypothetical protein
LKIIINNAHNLNEKFRIYIQKMTEDVFTSSVIFSYKHCICVNKCQYSIWGRGKHSFLHHVGTAESSLRMPSPYL